MRSKRFEDVRHLIDYEKVLQDMGFETFLDRNEVWCSCPFTDNHKNGDSRPSFSVHVGEGTSQGLWNCFVCGGGNFIQLVSELNGEPYEDVLARFIGIYYNGETINLPEEVEGIFRRKDIVTDTDTKTSFDRPGFVHHEWMDQFTPEAVEYFGLTYDEKKDGVIIPHYWRGVLVGWQIRLFSGKPKYINTPKFPKRNTLFGYDGARDYDHVIVVEGPKAVMKLWGMGIRNVVATFGASVTSEQITTLMGFSEVSTWFDNDEAGRLATDHVVSKLAGICDVSIVPFVPGDKADPADLDPTDVRKYISKRRSYLELLLQK